MYKFVFVVIGMSAYLYNIYTTAMIIEIVFS